MSAKIVIFAILAVIAVTEASLLAPAVAPVAYTHSVPYNVPPFASSVNIVNRAVRVPLATYAAAPVLHAAPLAAGVIPAPALARVPIAPHVVPAVHAHAAPIHAHAAPVLAHGLALPHGHAYAAPAVAAPIGYALPAHYHK